MRTNTVVVALLLVVLIVPPGTYDGLGGGGALEVTRAPDPVLDLESGMEAPTWSKGDYWNYSIDFEYNILIFKVPFEGYLNMSVVAASPDPFSGLDPAYITNVTGNLSGFFDIPLTDDDIEIYVEIKGYMWTRMLDLSIYRTVANATVTGTVDDINGEYPFGYEYYPALEEYDFPLIPGDMWSQKLKAGAPFDDGSSAPVNLSFISTCLPEESTSVPAGTFDTLPVSQDGVKTLWYNETVGNAVKRVFPISLGGEDYEAPLELFEYEHKDVSSVIHLEVVSPQHIEAGDEFDVAFRLDRSNVMVSLLFPAADDYPVEALVGSQKTFTHKFTAPWVTDDTPTNNDHASFGIMAYVIGTGDIEVCTVSTRARDLSVNNSSLSVSFEGSGTVEDLFTADVKVFNHFHFKAEYVDVVLRLVGNKELINQTVPVIEGHTVWQGQVDFSMDEHGDYTLELVVDPDDLIAEFNETNNRVDLVFEVLERPPLEVDINLPEGDHILNETEFLQLVVTSSRGGEDYPPGNWFIDDLSIGASPDILFTTSYIGNHSSREEPYRIRHVLVENTTFEGERDTYYWNITVVDVNRAPSVTDWNPPEAELEIDEGSTQQFSILAADPDGDELTYTWKVDGVVENSTEGNLTFFSGYLGPNSSEGSPFLVEVYISDGKENGTVSVNWTLGVENVDRAPIISVSPEPGNMTLNITEQLNFSFSFEDPDGDHFFWAWSVMGDVSFTPEVVLIPQDLGISDGDIAVVLLAIEYGNRTFNFSWNITVVEPYVPPPPVVVDPPQGVEILSPSPTDEFYLGDPVNLTTTADDSRPLVYRWTLNGSIYIGPHHTITDLTAGNHTLLLNVSVEGHPEAFVELQRIVRVKAPIVEEEEDDEDRDMVLWPYILGAVVVFLILGAMVLLLILRRQDSTHEE